MGFWSGLTGHQPGAFKGFSMKDIFDKDMWERRERLNQGRRLEETGVPDTTAIYKGMAKPGMFGDVVGRPHGGSSGAQPRMGVGRDRPFPLTNVQLTPRQQPRMAIGRDRPFAITPPSQREPYPMAGNMKSQFAPYPGTSRDLTQQQIQARPSLLDVRIQESLRNQQGQPTAARYSIGVRDALSALGDAAGNFEEGLFGPTGHRADALRDTGARILENPTSLLSDARDYWMPADKKTVIKRSANPAEADTETTTITEKMLGPSGHRMGALKDTAKDIWGDVSKPNFLSDPEFWRRFW